MKERPIIFPASMVSAILDSRKTQIRRAIKFKVWQDCPVITMTEFFEPFTDSPQNEQFWSADHQAIGKILVEQNLRCPYGQVGDRLWVKETFFHPYIGNKQYKAEKWRVMYKATNPIKHRNIKWISPIFMPKKYSRITLDITKIRVERVQEISAKDQVAEGVSSCERFVEGFYINEKQLKLFSWLWNSFNTKRGYRWDENPWVWVIEFKMIKKK